MNREFTNNGWIETVVNFHQIKLCKAIMSVKNWNSFNQKNPKIGDKRLRCDRCNKAWTTLPYEGNVNLCMMHKGINKCICDTCKSEIDQTLIIK